MKKMNKYELINNDGCLFDSVEATSFQNARKYFNQKYEGKFIILDTLTGERKNIVLK